MVFISMNQATEFSPLSEQLKRMKEVSVIAEGYREAKELDQLATAMINYVAMHNGAVVNRIALDPEKKQKLYFTYDWYRLQDMANADDFKVISEFITNSNVIFVCTYNTSAQGIYTGGRQKKITIDITKDGFEHNLRWQVERAEKDSDGRLASIEKAQSILRISFGVAFRSTIIHELQHAYDDYQSKGNYLKDRKSNDYYKNLKFKPAEANSVMTAAEKSIYLSLPHEYWARFSQAVAELGGLQQTWEELRKDFDWYFKGYDFLEKKDQERVLKAFYKYCDLHQLIKSNQPW